MKELACPHCGQDLNIPAHVNAAYVEKLERVAAAERDALRARNAKLERVVEAVRTHWETREMPFEVIDALADLDATDNR